MIFAYVALYVVALTLMIVGLLVPAIIAAVVAHSLGHRHAALRVIVPIKPIRDIDAPPARG